VKGPEVTHEDCCTLVFDTDAKNLYIEREVAHLDTSVDGTVEIRTVTMDIADYLKQGGLGCRSRTLLMPMSRSISHQRFAGRLGTLRNIRLAFSSARFAISTLILSIKAIGSNFWILRVEFMCAPSHKLCSAG
jgi:hypothetical protein